ncbi:M-phase inducer phosphatase 1-B-like [Saccostrea echinata]|uniref:M-phase inducer phosphatase 1-B-like n=1 Tax=Saccostrea echinata TaxID=191078 RepID=UPI002A83935D|nr:M-phase inducer phosphatase 1-B-like [Saccostrea echinata]
MIEKLVAGIVNTFQDIMKEKFIPDDDMMQSLRDTSFECSPVSPLTKQLMLTLRFDTIEEELSSVITPKRTTHSKVVRKISMTPRIYEELIKSPEVFEIRRRSTGLQRFATFESRRSLFSNKRDRPENLPCQKSKRARHSTEKQCQELQSEENDLVKIVDAMEAVLERDGITGDGQTTLGLPTIPGKHPDLNNISAETLGKLMKGEYADTIGSFRIIDCRYPYEFEGGHIEGAENIYTEEGIFDLLHSSNKDDTSNHKRNILIFHCEFSSERGPKKCRLLRNKDRELNKENYPFLKFPEIYLLHNGYKEFYTTNKTLCEPQSYKPMLHKDHSNDLKFFRQKSKSWSAGEKRKHARQFLRL